jgi:hypothetical protein
MSARSRHTVLGIGFAALLLQTVIQEPFFTTDKVALFKIVTPRDTILIGLSRDELETLHARDAATVARAIGTAGAMNVWRYAVRRNAAGELEQAPVKQIELLSAAALRVEDYDTPLHIVPASDMQVH